jgi:hypothetical protein
LEEGRVGAFGHVGFAATAFSFTFDFDLAGLLGFAEAFAGRCALRVVFVDLDFDLLVTI